VEPDDVSGWFSEYLETFGACGRGESDAVSLLAFYGIPLLLTMDGGFVALTSEDQLVIAVRQQIDGVRASGYFRSVVLDSETSVINRTSALYSGTFSRQRNDGGEILRLSATYLLTDGWMGRRISAIAVHSP
jgi:hypothetical protein